MMGMDQDQFEKVQSACKLIGKEAVFRALKKVERHHEGREPYVLVEDINALRKQMMGG